MLENFKQVSNPLTIIAIFAGITEVSGTAILPFVSQQNQFIYLLFLIVFPCLLVVLFFLTLNFNNKVLYAPSDFADEEHFVELMSRQITEVEARLGKTVEEELTKKVSGLEDSLSHHELLGRARDLFKSAQYDEALEQINRALEIKESGVALNLKAMIFSRKLKYKQAIDLCARGLDLDTNSAFTTASLYWNRACYKSLAKEKVNAVVEDLREAVLHNIELAEKLTVDKDLESVRDTAEYKDFVENLG